MNSTSLSKASFLVCTACLIYACFFFYPKWNKPAGEATIGWDVSGYYWYLPSIFIYKDLKHQEFGQSIIDKYRPTPGFEQSFVHEHGNRVMTYSSGMAVMYLPLFGMAHLSAKVLGYPADGFSAPYQFALQVGSLIAGLFGLWFFRKLYLMFYPEKVVAALLILLVLGTGYLNYTAIDGALAHNWLFVIYVFLLLNTINFYKSPSYDRAIAIGALCGLAILIRPSEIICVLIPLLWAMNSVSLGAIRDKLRFLHIHLRYILATSITLIAIASIQVAYWLYVTGKPLVYSYGDKSFSWLHPHLADYMFSYRSGWVTYTPMVILVLAGIIPFLFKGKNKVAVITFFVINLYIVSAWDIWWYGGTGGRAMLQSYPIILFPLASLLHVMFKSKFLFRILSPFVIAFACFNLWFTYNLHGGNTLYDSEGFMTKQYYWNIIFRNSISDEVYKLKDTDELYRGLPNNMTLLYEQDFENDTLSADSGFVISGTKSLVVRPNTCSPEYGTGVKGRQADWVRAQANFHSTNKEGTAWRMLQFVVRFKDNDKVVKERILRVHRHINIGETKSIYLDVKWPEEKVTDIVVFFWNDLSDKHMIIDNLKIWSFDER